jgi:pyruvate kinase
MLGELARAGMDIARMNFSHCQYAEYTMRKKALDKISAEIGREIKIMQDLQGPRLRVGKLPEQGRMLEDNEEVVFSTEKSSDEKVIFIDDPYLHADIKEGEPMYLANGAIEMEVIKVDGTKITARVIHGGVLFSNKAVNVPNTNLTTSGLTPKDMADIECSLKEGVDYIALSFVQSAADVEKLRSLLGGNTHIKIISKIERALALKNIDAIIQASDGIMVARGDLGAELPVEDLPIIQKNLIRHASWHDKASITATQMMLSMVNNPHPTRAEVSDVANAVLDGTDAVMLSDETASGQYPVEAVRMMSKIVDRAEQYHYYRPNFL